MSGVAEILERAAQALDEIAHMATEMVGVPVDTEAANAWAMAFQAATDRARQAAEAVRQADGGRS